jgi:hypothetical protein
MKKFWGIALALALLIVPVPQLIAAPAHQTLNADLGITKIFTVNELVRVGDPIVYGVTVENKDKAQIPESVEITLTLQVAGVYKNNDPKQRDWVCTRPITGSLKTGISNAISSTIYFDACQPKLRFEEEGNFTVKAELIGAGNQPLADRDAGNNLKEIQTSVEPYQTALPENIARVFAGLGLLSAVMALMAAGTEVVIDVLRVALGMKSKVTATDALERLSKVLPGKLAELGVDSAARESVRQLSANVQVTLKPTTDTADAFSDIKGGRLGDAFKKIAAINPSWQQELEHFAGTVANAGVDALEAEKLKAQQTVQRIEDQFKKDARTFLDSGIQNVASALKNIGAKWDDQLVADLRAKLAQEIDRVGFSAVKTRIATFDPVQGNSAELKAYLTDGKYLESAAQTLADAIQAYSPDVVVTWIRNQRDLSHDAIKTQITAIVQNLSAIGFVSSTASTTKLDRMIESARAATEPAITSLEKLLNSVEDSRNETQSPPRKVWRILRKMQHGTSFSVLGATALLWLACFIALYLDSHQPGEHTITASVLNGIGVILFWVAIAFIASIVPAFALSKRAQKNRDGVQVAPALANAQPNTTKNPNWLQKFWQGLKAITQKIRDWLQNHMPKWSFLTDNLAQILIALWAIIMVWLTVVIQPVWQAGQTSLISQASAPNAPLPQFWIGLVILLWLLLFLGLVRALASMGAGLYALDRSQTLSAEYNDFVRIEYLWNRLRGEAKNDPAQYGEPTTTPPLTSETAAAQILKMSDRQEDEESSRLRWLRAISVAVGIVLAYLLKVDAFDYLKYALPGIERINRALPLAGLPEGLTAGMVLTGFAASAGSAFWHDQLDRLQAAKKQAESVAVSVRQVKEQMTGENK